MGIGNERRFRCALGASLLAFCALTPPAVAQSFDCDKASTPVEQTICGSSDLRAADDTQARAFARLLADAGSDDAARLRARQRAWIVERNACGAAGDCLAQTYRARTAELARDRPLAAASPALPPGPPAGSARLSRASVPSAGDSEALLTVTIPGRFAIRASSRTGVALQIVDMITGPGEIAGDAGTRDGRLDLLLDAGTYKLRAIGAAIASGDATLSVTPFVLAAPADGSLVRGGDLTATLADGEQCSFWVNVGKDRRLSTAAAGRSLRDLRAWRDGTELVEFLPVSRTVEPVVGHPLTYQGIEGTVDPGLYLVTAYGGEPLPWSDDDASQPFSLHVGAPRFLPGGSVNATIGPTGVLRFALPAGASHVWLYLPEVAPARLLVGRGGKIFSRADIEKNSRSPVTALVIPAGTDTVAEVSGRQGQRFRLRALTPTATARVETSGSYVAAVDVAGDGGDEFPATAVLARFDKKAADQAARVIASDAIRVTPTTAWRRKLNLRGPSTLLIEVAGAGIVAARTAGVGVRVGLEPLLGANAPRADGRRPRQWDVEAGFYLLKIDPVGGAIGVLDLTFGAPDLAIEPLPSVPPRDTIDFGLRSFESGSAHQLFVNTAPGLVLAPRLRTLPADLSACALSIVQQGRAGVAAPAPAPAPAPASTPQRADGANRKPPPPKPERSAAKPLPPKPVPALAAPPTLGGPLTIAVTTPAGGTIGVTDESGRAVPFTKGPDRTIKALRTSMLTIPPTDATRALLIAWSPDVPDEPLATIARDAGAPRLLAGTPAFFDIARDDTKRFVLDVPDGGLYRVETLGRLKTAAAIGTAFLPKLDSAEDNGSGHNALLQTWLRGGTYRVRVTAKESEGHGGIVAKAARLLAGATLRDGGSGRATLADGAGVAFPIEISETGDYRLDLHAIDGDFTARLEDAEGWPLAKPGELSTLRRHFEKGRYRLVVMPPEVDAQVVVRLRREVESQPVAGHGPHLLPFEDTARAQWREPADKDGLRLPDRWEFQLEGPARISLQTSEGMTGELSAATRAEPIARIAGDRPFSGDLAAGRYVLAMRSIGRNDRLDYTLDLRSDALQPDRPRTVELPATLPFAIAADRIVGLTTFGDTQLSGIVRNEARDVVERLVGRTDDWNFAFSRPLPAGKYTLSLTALPTPRPESETAKKPDEPEEADSEASTAAADAATPPTDPEPAKTEGARRKNAVEVRLSLPSPNPARSLALSGAETADERGISRFRLLSPDAGTLLILAAETDAEIVLTLERRGADGSATLAGLARGRSPVLAVPIDAGTRDSWEVALWQVDGAPLRASVAARAMSLPSTPPGIATLTAVASNGPLAAWRIGRAAAPSRTLLNVSNRTAGLLVGSKAGRPLQPIEIGLVSAQADDVWLVAPAGTHDAVAIGEVENLAGTFTLALDAGDRATLPGTPPKDGLLRVWRADATDGQPGFLPPTFAGVAQGSAVAIEQAAAPAVAVGNSAGNGAIALRVRAVDLVLPPIRGMDGVTRTVPAGTAQRLSLPPGTKRIDLQLAPGLAAALSEGDTPQVVWAGDLPASRELTGAWTELLLANTTATPAPATVGSVPAAAVAPLTAGTSAKRFHGAAGSVTLPVAAAAGDRLTVLGGAATFVGADGRVLRGSPLELTGPGSLTVDHPAGLVVAAVTSGTATPWVAPDPVAVPLPATTTLAGAAMAFRIPEAAPRVLRVRTSAPVILALHQGGQDSLQAMPDGADARYALAAGAAELRVFPPHDGPLVGTLDLSVEPATPIGDGVGAPQIVGAGGSLLFAFTVERSDTIGVGVRADPDHGVAVRLRNETGDVLGEGPAQLRRLDKGRYLLEARAPADGPAVTIRPALVGLQPRPDGPPPDVAAKYLELVGMTRTQR